MPLIHIVKTKAHNDKNLIDFNSITGHALVNICTHLKVNKEKQNQDY